MRPDEIKVGHLYSNGRGGLRRVLAAGNKLHVYGRKGCDAVCYEVVASGTHEKVGLTHNISRDAFAKWAKEEMVLSRCCTAPCRVEGSTTNFYVCTACGQACDAGQPPAAAVEKEP